MIIDFRNIGGGGGSGYTLPVATSSVLGGVKIGEGVNIDSAGTISVSGCSEAEMALALKSIQEGDEDNYKVVNDGGWLYYVEQERVDEEGIFVKVRLDSAAVLINMDLSGQTAPEGETIDLVSITYNGGGSGMLTFTFRIDDQGDLYYDNGEEYIYYDPNEEIYGGQLFSFSWLDDGKLITFDQSAVNPVDDIVPQTGNYDILHCIGNDMKMANEGNLGLVKIGEGINLAEDGTISVDASGIEVVDELPASGTDGQMVVLKTEHTTEIKVENTFFGTTAVTVTGKNLTEKTLLFKYEFYAEVMDIYMYPDDTIEAHSNMLDESYEFDDDGEFDVYDYPEGTPNRITLTKVDDGEWLFENAIVIAISNVNNISPYTTYKNYIWCDNEVPSLDINLSGANMLNNESYYSEVEFMFDQIPEFEGSAFTICMIGNAGTQDRRYIKYTSEGNFVWGPLPWTQDEYGVLYKDGQMHYAFDNIYDKYLITDNYIKIIAEAGDIISFVTINSSNPLGYDELWNGQIERNGWIEVGRRGILEKGQNNYSDFVFYVNGQRRKYYGSYGISITEPPYAIGGNKVLMTKGFETMEWSDLVIPKTEIYQSLPYGGSEGDLVLTNSEYSITTASTFIAMNSTNESDKNNFSNDNEMNWYDWGNNYIYFGNASAYTNTSDTFLYRIALRTNENGDWNTSNIAYINVIKADDTYEIFMDNFSYYDTGGTPTPYTFTMILSSTGTTSGNTPYLPLWRWWDGGYGYKFHFEIDQYNNLKMWMRHSDADRDSQDPDYVQGQNYGAVGFKCMDHTEIFYSHINFDQDDTHFSIYKGGVWYELGYLTRQGV